MEYEEIKLVKQSEKSTVHLVRGEGELFIRKTLTGQHSVYQVLQDNPHPCLPRIQEVTVTEDSTTVIEEYIEGRTSGTVELSEKQYRQMVRELCSVLEFLHGKGIIHRDIKPSNILLTEDGHVRLIDFDAARMRKEGQEQDTRQLGTRGFAPPEQYGFAQTDERADIYALGVTLEQLLPEKMGNQRYRKVLRKCTNLDPDQRYQSVEELRRAFFPTRRNVLWGCGALCLLVLIGACAIWLPTRGGGQTGTADEGAELTVLPAPENPHWDGETGIAAWGNVPEAGIGDELQFWLRLYKRDTETPPEPDDEDWYFEDKVRIGGALKKADILDIYSVVTELDGNGFYYFTISAVGNGIQYADSPYVVSDAFAYTGESAPPLPTPEGLAWRLVERNNTRYHCATWSNLDDYEDKDTFNVTFYDETGAYVMNNTWPMSQIRESGLGGIFIPAEFLVTGPGKAYRFTVQAYSSRPNEYGPSPMPDPVPEEYYGPWLRYEAAE